MADKLAAIRYEVALANRPGGKPLVEHYERVCIENNGPFGQVAIPEAH